MSYTLDDAGNRTERTDDNGTQSYTYDGLCRLTGVTYPDDRTVDYTYDADAAGNRLTLEDASGTTDKSPLLYQLS